VTPVYSADLDKCVVAHVFGHTDFFKHNAWFDRTNRQMIESASQNAQRIRQYGFAEGDAEVERFLDAVLSISDHIDPYPRRERVSGPSRPRQPDSLRGHSFSDLFPPDLSAAPAPDRRRQIPPEPEKDLLLFLLQYADHLEDWQRDVLAIVREESLYFVPQIQTKIMNEGWASFWHSRIMRALDLDDAEHVEFMRLHSSVCAPGRTRLNPYFLGLRIFEDLEERFGREKIFTVREQENDVSFLRNFLTEELCRDLDLFVFALQDDAWTVTDKAWEKVRDTIVDSMTNFGQPYIVVEDGDYRGRRELYLRHQHDGRDLDVPYAERTLEYVHRLWQHPVHLKTQEGERACLYTCDGETVTKAFV